MSSFTRNVGSISRSRKEYSIFKADLNSSAATGQKYSTFIYDAKILSRPLDYMLMVVGSYGSAENQQKMNPGRDDLEFEIVSSEGKSVIGIVRCRKDCTFAEIRHEIVEDEVIGYPFKFVNSQGYPLNAKQEQRWKVSTTTVGIKRKLDTIEIDMIESNVMERAPNFESTGENVVEPMHEQPRVEGDMIESNVMERAPNFESTGENVVEPMHEQPRVEGGFESVEQTLAIDPVLLASWEKKVNSLMKQFVKEKLNLQVSSEKGKPQIKIHCESCGINYGTGEISLATRTIRNFRNSHMNSVTHQRNILRVGNKEIPSCNEVPQTMLAGDRFEIDQAIKLLDDFNKTQDPNLFKVVDATLGECEDKKRVRVECTRCNRWFSLVPASGNIVSSLNEHMKSKNHISKNEALNEALHNTSWLRTGTVGRPKKPTIDKSQQSLTRFLVPSSPSVLHRGSTSVEASISDPSSPLILQCWGYWDPYIDRNGERLDTKVLLDDQRGGKLWAIEKHTKGTLCYYGTECRIDGTYRHIHCKRASESGIPFDSLTCKFCKLIPKCDDFRMRLYRESRSAIKRQQRDTGKGRRLDYLTQTELETVSRVTNASHK